MKLDQLVYFLEAAREEHVLKASKILAISPSAISHAIRSLEDELGQSLFLREGKKIVLTHKGKKLRERVGEILVQIQKLKEEFQDEEKSLDGYFRIGSTHGFAKLAICKPVAEMQLNNKDLYFELFSFRSIDVINKVLSGEMDIGFCFSPQPHPKLFIQILANRRLHLAANTNHSLFSIPEKQRLRRLSDYPSIAPKAFSGIENCETHPIFDELNIEPRVILIYDNYEIAKEYLLNSQAWTLLPEKLIADSKGKLSIISRYQPIAQMNLAVIWKKQRVLLKPLKTLIDKVVSHL